MWLVGRCFPCRLDSQNEAPAINSAIDTLKFKELIGFLLRAGNCRFEEMGMGNTRELHLKICCRSIEGARTYCCQCNDRKFIYIRRYLGGEID